MTFNQEVIGSNPIVPTKENQRLQRFSKIILKKIVSVLSAMWVNSDTFLYISSHCSKIRVIKKSTNLEIEKMDTKTQTRDRAIMHAFEKKQL